MAKVWDLSMCFKPIKCALYGGSIVSDQVIPNFPLTLDLWLNFDSSVWIITPGPPSLGIGCKISACHTISLNFRAILMRTLRDAIPSKNIALKESLWAHFQRSWTCRCSESLLPSKNDPVLRDLNSPHRWHFLVNTSILVVTKQSIFIIISVWKKNHANYLPFTGCLPTTDIHQVSVGKY